MFDLNLDELYRRVARNMGKSPSEVKEGIAELIRHAWPLLSEADKLSLSGGEYPTAEQFLSFLVIQTQEALDDCDPPASSGQEE